MGLSNMAPGKQLHQMYYLADKHLQGYENMEEELMYHMADDGPVLQQMEERLKRMVDSDCSKVDIDKMCEELKGTKSFH